MMMQKRYDVLVSGYSAPIEVTPGTRVVVVNGYIEFTTSSLARCLSDSAAIVWSVWPNGTIAGTNDVIRKCVIRVVATSAGCYATVDDGYFDAPFNDSFYWQDKTLDINLEIGNTSLGYRAGGNNTLGGTVAIGPDAFASAAAVNDSVAIGSEAGKSQVSCVGNTYVGRLAGEKNVTGGNNTAFGDSALRDCTVNGNTAVGYIAGEKITTGEGNALLGLGAALLMTTGAQNTAVGASVLPANLTGNRNTVMGFNAGRVVTGHDNVAIGYLALYNHTQLSGGNQTGENVAVGSNAGTVTTTGIRNTFVGTSAGGAGQSATAIQSTAIGWTAVTTKDNQMVLGGTNVVETLIRGAPIFTSIPSSVTPANNGEFAIEETNNTTITLKLRGTDGTVRSVALTLA